MTRIGHVSSVTKALVGGRNHCRAPKRLVDVMAREAEETGAVEDFSEFVSARWLRLVRFAILLGCGESEAEDVVQAALEKCFTRWARVTSATDRDAYVHKVVVNTFTSTRRKRSSSEAPVERLSDLPSQDDLARVDSADAVMRCLEKLSEEHRTVLVLRYYAQMSEQQMVSALGIPPGTVKSRLSRALRGLSADPDIQELTGRSL